MKHRPSKYSDAQIATVLAAPRGCIEAAAQAAGMPFRTALRFRGRTSWRAVRIAEKLGLPAQRPPRGAF
jgi:hypothetical protein